MDIWFVPAYGFNNFYCCETPCMCLWWTYVHISGECVPKGELLGRKTCIPAFVDTASFLKCLYEVVISSAEYGVFQFFINSTICYHLLISALLWV